jgi:hypothetical protein
MSHGLMKSANFRIECRGCFSQVKDMCKLDKFPSRQITRSISVVDPSILEPNIKTKPQARFLYSGKVVKITSTRKCLEGQARRSLQPQLSDTILNPKMCRTQQCF